MTRRPDPARAGADAPRRRAALMLAPIVAALASCAAVGPNFRSPQPPAAQSYAAPGDASSATAVLSAESRAGGAWWLALRSPALDDVMTRALKNNQTLAAARATLEKVQAEAQRQRASLGPAVNAAASYSRERINTSAFGFTGFPSPTINFYSVGPTVSYDLDLAGGGRRGLEAARARVEAQGFRADAAYLALTGNVAIQAVKIAALRQEIETVEAIAADDRQSLEILRAAEAAGGGTSSQGLGGRLQVEQDEALLPPLRQELAQARHALAMLAGESPDRYAPPDFAVEGFIVPDRIPVAVPSILVRRRPDIQAAEADLHADTALVGVETARLYPDLRIVAGLTQEGLTPAALTGFGGTAYNFGPALTAPIFDGGAIRAQRRAAQAQARADLAQYRQTVISAFVQVSDVLSALAEDEARLASLERAEMAAKASLQEARAGYDAGGVSLAQVVIEDRRWRQSALAKAQAVGQRLTDIVALYAATAADWRDAPASATSR